MVTINEMVYWNARTYGKALIIKRRWLISAAIALCLATPATNWLIPVLPKMIKHNMRI